MANIVFGSFSVAGEGEKAAAALIDRGARAEDISLVRSDSREYRGPDEIQGTPTSFDGSVYGTTSALSTPGFNDIEQPNQIVANSAYAAESDEVRYAEGESDLEHAAKEGFSTTTPGDAGAGAVKGIGWGIGVGILAAIASITIPGVGIVIGGGALATAIAGAAATAGAGAIAGGITGYLRDQGVDDHVAAHYDEDLRNGGALLSITVPSGNLDEAEARAIVEKYGAGHVHAGPTRGYVA